MKKAIFTFVICGLLFLSVTGCGKSKTEKKDTEKITTEDVVGNYKWGKLSDACLNLKDEETCANETASNTNPDTSDTLELILSSDNSFELAWSSGWDAMKASGTFELKDDELTVKCGEEACDQEFKQETFKVSKDKDNNIIITTTAEKREFENKDSVKVNKDNLQLLK